MTKQSTTTKKDVKVTTKVISKPSVKKETEN